VSGALEAVDKRFDRNSRELDLLFVRSLLGMVQEDEEPAESPAADSADPCSSSFSFKRRRKESLKSSTFFFGIHSLLQVVPDCPAISKLLFTNK